MCTFNLDSTVELQYLPIHQKLWKFLKNGSITFAHDGECGVEVRKMVNYFCKGLIMLLNVIIISGDSKNEVGPCPD
jgi:hypothetical protein